MVKQELVVVTVAVVVVHEQDECYCVDVHNYTLCNCSLTVCMPWDEFVAMHLWSAPEFIL